jgi:starch synthase
MNMMKGGILFSDRVTTVSPRYAQEILTPEFGCGLDGVVQTRIEDLSGLINGIDTAQWNPVTDALLPANFSATDLAGKAACRAELLRRHGFDPEFTGPVFGMVCRLTEQKGLDLVLANRDFFIGQNCRLIVLGSGERRYEEALCDLAAAHPKKIGFNNTRCDEALSHLIEAGSDYFLMPSLFEPCGLNQMYSQAYGTIPIVSRVGGLVDTVIDVTEQPKTGTGLMGLPTADGLSQALSRAMKLFADQPRYAAVQQRGMARDFSWQSAAKAHERLYQEAL